MRDMLNQFRTLPPDEMAVLCMLVAAAALLMLCGVALAMAWRNRRRVAKLREEIAVDHEQAAATTHALADLLERMDRVLAGVQDRADRAAIPVDDDTEVEVKASGILPRRDATLDPLTRGVYNLADQGYAPVQIAQELEEHIGKVELILALRAI